MKTENDKNEGVADEVSAAHSGSTLRSGPSETEGTSPVFANAPAHTPGPWTMETVKTSTGICHKIGPFPYRPDRQNHACIYVDYGGIGGPIETELEANARLIRTAPELLAACDRTPNPSGSGTMSNYFVLDIAITALRAEGHHTLANELEAIQKHQRAAIAKAEGR